MAKVYRGVSGALFRRDGNTLEIVQNAPSRVPLRPRRDRALDALDADIGELKRRLKEGKCRKDNCGTAWTVVKDTKAALCSLGMRPKDIDRRVTAALVKGMYQDVQALIVATMKEV